MELFLVVSPDTDQGQGITYDHGLDSLIECRRAAQRWQHIHFQKPWFEFVVNHDIEAIELETVDP